jgi:hypothetical protein
MSLWIRLGHFSLSSRGRAGIRVGPISAYGGGRRRRTRARRHASTNMSAREWTFSICILLIVTAIVLAVQHPYVGLPSVAIAGVLAATVYGRVRTRHRLQEEEATRAAARSYQQWLEGPPPPLATPSRFTQTWIADNVPRLHPGQMPVLFEEMRSRGWSERDLELRVVPYLPPTLRTAAVRT